MLSPEITLTETLIIPDITKTESNNCFIIHCFEENNDKRVIAAINLTLLSVNLTLLLELSCIERATYRLFTNL